VYMPQLLRMHRRLNLRKPVEISMLC
jgi:hypothetical protein